MDEHENDTKFAEQDALNRRGQRERMESGGVACRVTATNRRQPKTTRGSARERSGSVRICSEFGREGSTRSTPPKDPVLLVDDDPLLIQAVRIGLESHGYHVIEAHDGREALEALRRERACLVLLDLEMPGMNGWQFREEQCGDPTIASVPVVVVSSRTDAERQANLMHVAGGLQKPVDLDQLHATVRAQCGGAPA